LPGIINVLQHYKTIGISKLLWINMRTEPVVYVQNKSFAPRLKENPKENLEIEGLGAKDIFSLENYLVEQVLKPSILSNANSMHYFRDTYSLVPADRIDTEHELTEVKDSEVVTVSKMYETVNTLGELPVDFVRVPINDVPNERVPELHEFDYLIEIVTTKVDESTGIHCNCQMGRGRTTTGMFICALIMSKNQNKSIDVSEQTIRAKTPENGYYSFVNELVKLVPQAQDAKLEIDALMDQCDHLINMRGFIWKCKGDYEKEIAKGNESRADFWKNLAINYVERYVYFILFCLYLTAHVSISKMGPDQSSFKTWCESKEDVFVKVIGRKPGKREDVHPILPNFQWE